MQRSTDERIVLNVGGIRYETFKSTLLKYPDTLLAAMFSERNKDLLVKDANGYFFYSNLKLMRISSFLSLLFTLSRIFDIQEKM